ncbi:dockerin type I domain-containing protein [Rhodopirellula sp. MGV]|uniref:dockerin type I domain-containing protein n=1 Tax=Rhodopirellula sp. MGV TaxID=2023130 RepID=UPI000B9623F9|nr:dockerin type I domain-containing protein [Rhodopirellula sp. MGV]OYP39099.1 hypothetical protein CGZ80_00155 [Rhodopirellula sp. MGV]PNY35525.1 hypothetical protein C2E31_18690 [Rhodopirellula baltica]
MKPRLLKRETLETRQLLAGDVCDTVQLAVASTFAEGEGTRLADASLSRSTIASDWVEEDSGQLVAIRMSPSYYGNGIPGASLPSGPLATAYLYQRDGNGELQSSGTIEFDFFPERLIWTENELVIIGTNDRGAAGSSIEPETYVLSVNREQLLDRSRRSLEGELQSVVVDSDRLFISTKFQITSDDDATSGGEIVPNVGHRISVYDLAKTELTKITSGETDGPLTDGAIRGDDLLILEPTATFSQASPFARRLTHYKLSDEGLTEQGGFDVQAAAEYRIQFAADGDTATLVSTSQPAGATSQATTANQFATDVQVTLVDFSAESPSLFDAFEVPLDTNAFDYTIAGTSLLIDSAKNDAIIVNLDQSVDLDTENRIQRRVIPPATFPIYSVRVQALTRDLLAISRTAQISASQSSLGNSANTQVTLYSISSGQVTGQVNSNADAAAFFLPGNDEPELMEWTDLANQIRTHRLSVFDVDGSADLTERNQVEFRGATELDTNSDRLIVRQVDQMLEFPWDGLDQPNAIALGDSLAPPHAVDDVIEHNVEWQYPYLNVLDNDEFAATSTAFPAKITDLIDAPEGITLNEQGRLRLSNELLATGGDYEFSYVVQQSRFQTVGNVSLSLIRYEQSEISDLRNQVIEFALADLEIFPESISFERVVPYVQIAMPAELSNGADNPLGGRFGIITELVVNDQLYRYAADFDDNVVRLDSRIVETAMELSMRSIDGTGQAVDSLEPGDEFFIEVTAKDVRPFGAGVFAVGFDLPIPPAQLELTGEIQFLGDWDPVFTQDLTNSIDDLYAVELEFDHPGNAAQPVVRIGVRAIAGGHVTLQLNPAEGRGRELLLRSRNDEVSPFEVSFGSLQLEIAGIRPSDTDASGAVTPMDALRVINFLARYGDTAVDDLPNLVPNTGEGEEVDLLTRFQRLDTNADGIISVRDALRVINDLAIEYASNKNSSEGELILADSTDQKHQSWSTGLVDDVHSTLF